MKRTFKLFVLSISIFSMITKAKAENPFARNSFGTTRIFFEDFVMHSFLKPPYNDGRYNADIVGFKKELKLAANGETSNFQDPLFQSRVEKHLRTVLGDKYPAGGVQEIIDSSYAVAAPGNLSSVAYLGRLVDDFNGPVDWFKREANRGEMILVYKGVPWISTDCGNFVRLDLSYRPAPPSGSTNHYDTNIVKHGPNGDITINITNTNSNTNSNTNTTNTPATGTMGFSNVSFAGSGNQQSNAGNQASNQPSKQIIEYRNKVHWSEAVRNVGLGLGVASLGVASLKNAFDPEPIDININGGGNWGNQSNWNNTGSWNNNGGWGTNYNYTNLNPPQPILNTGWNGQFNTSTLNPVVAGNYGGWWQ